LAQVLRPLSGIFPAEDYPALLVGLAAPDDAAVYRVDAERAIISTMDFFPPVVDDAYDFGAIAAANALSDVYAMGGEVLMAINLVAYPDGYGMGMLTEILRGGAEKVREAGAIVAGGHTVTDKEPKYGLAVTGVVHPDKIITKSGAFPGDKLILSKPLGTGVITTALKNQKANSEHVKIATNSMCQLNQQAAMIAQAAGVHAMSDITGFGLLGHVHEMAHSGAVDFHVSFAALRWLPGAIEYAQADNFPGGMERNRQFFDEWVKFDGNLQGFQQELLFDPQTSGGLMMVVEAEKAQQVLGDLIASGHDAAIIGDVKPGDGHIVVSG
jgi:selenide, water dikinase